MGPTLFKFFFVALLAGATAIHIPKIHIPTSTTRSMTTSPASTPHAPSAGSTSTTQSQTTSSTSDQSPEVTSAVPPTPPGEVPHSSCISKEAPFHLLWGVYVVNNTMSTKDDSLAGNFCDKLKAKVGCKPRDWQCQSDNHGGVGCTFSTSSLCKPSDVNNMIIAASGQNVYCQGDSFNYLYNATGQVASGFLEFLGPVAELLTGLAAA